MARLDHTTASIAETYAEALYELADAGGATDAVLEEVEAFRELMEKDTAFADFMMNPAMDAEVRRAFLEKHFRGKFGDLFLNTLLVVNRKGRTALLPLICEHYRAAHERARNEVDVEVTSAVPLNDTSRRAVLEAMARVTGKTARLVERVDPSILGGLVVRIGDRKFDASLVRRLEGIRETLLERATQEAASGRAVAVANGG